MRFFAARGIPSAENRRCYDCKHLVGYVSLWCDNSRAVEWRGTSIPGVRNCPFWQPLPEARDLTKRERCEMIGMDLTKP